MPAFLRSPIRLVRSTIAFRWQEYAIDDRILSRRCLNGGVERSSLAESGPVASGGPGEAPPEAGLPQAGPPEAGSARWWAERAASASRRRPRPGGLSSQRIVEAALDVLRER